MKNIKRTVKRVLGAKFQSAVERENQLWKYIGMTDTSSLMHDSDLRI